MLTFTSLKSPHPKATVWVYPRRASRWITTHVSTIFRVSSLWAFRNTDAIFNNNSRRQGGILFFVGMWDRRKDTTCNSPSLHQSNLPDPRSQESHTKGIHTYWWHPEQEDTCCQAKHVSKCKSRNTKAHETLGIVKNSRTWIVLRNDMDNWYVKCWDLWKTVVHGVCCSTRYTRQLEPQGYVTTDTLNMCLCGK